MPCGLLYRHASSPTSNLITSAKRRKESRQRVVFAVAGGKLYGACRHSYATQLKANGEDVKVVQESLRHANSRITLDTYTQAITPAKRQAQTKVVSMILPKQIQTAKAGGGD